MRAAVNSLSLGASTNLALMAPIKPGLVPDCFETISHVDRLQRLLNALNASRTNAREGELRLPVLPDAIGRFRVIRHFRYAIWPRRTGTPGAEPSQSYLTLNVGFDGGFEPYMRVIYDDIGPLLDALLCHCEGYPGARRSTFDDYCRWVRQHELSEGTFYTDAESGAETTAADARHLARLERAQREAADAEAADLAAATLALTPLERELAQAMQTVFAEFWAFRQGGPKPPSMVLPLRTLKGLYRLATLFPAPRAAPSSGLRDDWVLRGFAGLVLGDLVGVFSALMADPVVPVLLKQALRDEVQWLTGPTYPARSPSGRLTFNAKALQNSILNRTDPVTHGALVLLQVADAQQAAATLASLRPLCDQPANGSGVRHLVALTAQGLRALGASDAELDAWAPEFVEGMEARSSILGDVRGNHPNQWRRPKRWQRGAAGSDRIDLSQVHVAVLLRCIDITTPRDSLHPQLKIVAEALGSNTGLRLLAVEELHAREAANGGVMREAFGFADGLSQPKPVQQQPGQTLGTDEVLPGELVLGHVNGHRDEPYPARPNAWLDNGSYLVLRKLRQYPERLDGVLQSHPSPNDIKARMMGRRQDGTPLVPGYKADQNGFDYKADPEGRHCPFQSHVRRANPRDGRPYTPRILRRGMAYGAAPPAGPEAERGILFMAYCGSIAEQFETLQGWIAGGNSSGVSSAQSDPLLGVPRPGEKRSFRYVETSGGKAVVRRVDLGDQPFVELQWGLYLFVPSLEGLTALPRLGGAPAVAAAAPAPGPAVPPVAEPASPLLGANSLQAWRERLEDQDRSPAVWAALRNQGKGRFHAVGYGTLVSDRDDVLAVLRDDGRAYSVKGYEHRMRAGIGLNYLGLDPATGHDQQAAAVNPGIQAINESQAHEASLKVGRRVLAGFGQLAMPAGSGQDGHGLRVPVDLVSFSETALAGLCALWFGLPDGQLMVAGGVAEGDPQEQGPPRCPAHAYAASRTIFSPHPNEITVERSQRQGPRMLQAVTTLLAQVRQGQRQPTPLVRDSIAALDQAFQVDPAKIPPGHDAMVAGNLAGLVLGFAPTVHSNLMRVLRSWVEDGSLWTQQQRLADALATLAVKPPAAAEFTAAKEGLRGPLMQTLRRCPLPETLWRSPVVNGKPVPEAADVHSDRRLVLGIRSLMTDPTVDDTMMFGGSRTDPNWQTPHACPGQAMGVGVMLGLLHALLDAGTLRPTGSSVLLVLTPPQPD